MTEIDRVLVVNQGRCVRARHAPASWFQIVIWLTLLVGRIGKPYSSDMNSLRARVEKGRLVLDEPTALPEGTVVDLVADDEGDDLTNEERRALNEALSTSWRSAEAGSLQPASRILDELRRQR